MRTLLGAVLLIAAPLFAQTPSRLTMIGEWEHQKKHALAVVDVAPDSMLGFRTTPGVRTFAEQVIHAAGSGTYIVADALGTKAPTDLMGDRNVFYNNKAALRSQTAKFYDYIIGILKTASDSTLLRDVTMFDGVKPAWLWVVTAHSHGAWTLGQTVPYLRMNNVKPPEFTPF